MCTYRVCVCVCASAYNCYLNYILLRHKIIIIIMIKMLSLRNSINCTVLLLLLASVCHKFVFVHIECVITPMIQSEHNFFKCRLAIVGFIIVYKENHILFPIHYSSNPLWFYMFRCNVNCLSTFFYYYYYY